jgi:N-acyl-L-homoserine lactone synthetase
LAALKKGATMLAMIDRGNHVQEDNILRGMFEARKQVFIDLLKWPLPVLAGRYEVDQFDGPECIYLVITDERGGHLGSARLLATTQPGILNSLCLDLCDSDPPSGPAVYEITRFCLSRNLRARERRDVRDWLVVAIAEYGLEMGIETYTGVAEFGWMQQILAFGWHCAPLGFFKVRDGATLGALRIDLEPDTLDRLEAAGIHGRESVRIIKQAA